MKTAGGGLYRFNSPDPNLRKARQRGCRGFTLMEVLVAMMVLAVCMTLIMGLFSGGLKSAGLSDQYSRAVFHAQAKMEEMLLTRELVDGVLEGEFEDGFAWKVRILWVQPDEDAPELPFDTFKITVTVSWREGEREREVTLSTLHHAEMIEAEDETA